MLKNFLGVKFFSSSFFFFKSPYSHNILKTDVSGLFGVLFIEKMWGFFVSLLYHCEEGYQQFNQEHQCTVAEVRDCHFKKLHNNKCVKERRGKR